MPSQTHATLARYTEPVSAAWHDILASMRQIVGLIGVYDANGSLRGELAYWIGARLGRTHCALCDITHGSVRERPAWRVCRAGLAVPFVTYHRNDQPDEVRVATRDIAPAVVAEIADGLVPLLGPAELEACHGSIAEFVATLDRVLERLDLSWPST